MTIEPNEAFALPFSFTKLPITSYAIKIRFSNDPKKCEPQCTGETFQTHWLKQSDDWIDHPTVVTDSSGKAQGFIIGRLPLSETVPSYLQIAIKRIDGTSTTPEVLDALTRSISLRQGKTPVTFAPYDGTGKSYNDGFIKVLDEGEERFLPITEGIATTRLASQSPVVRVVDAAGSPRSDFQPYHLLEDGYYRIAINPPPPQYFSPQLSSADTTRYPNQDITLTLHTATPYSGSVEWFIDGMKQKNDSGISLTTRFSTAGQRTISAVLIDSQESAALAVIVRPYTDIRLHTLLPNPSGKDTDEVIVLKNNYPFPVTLTKWELRSRTSSTKVPLSLTLPADGEATIKTSNRLINKDGSYELYSNENQLIDTVAYGEAPEDGVLFRQGIMWQFDRDVVTRSSLTPSEPPITVVGQVTLPRGRTIDIMTTDGQSVHVVLHPSYTKEKPRLSKGDTIRVTGVWRVSRAGPYLSVRAEHSLFVVSSTKQAKKAPSASPKKSPTKLIPKAKAAPQTHDLPTGHALPHATSPPISPFAPPLFLRWVFVICLTTGVWLLLPFPEEKTV